MRSRRTHRVGLGCLGGASACAALGAVACSQPSVGANLHSDVPQERIMGLAEAMRTGDEAAIPEYVTMLRSDDPAVRMFAIRALQDLTGETFGYDYGAPGVDRTVAIERWEEWLSTWEAPIDVEGTAGL